MKLSKFILSGLGGVALLSGCAGMRAELDCKVSDSLVGSAISEGKDLAGDVGELGFKGVGLAAKTGGFVAGRYSNFYGRVSEGFYGLGDKLSETGKSVNNRLSGGEFNEVVPYLGEPSQNPPFYQAPPPPELPKLIK